MKPLLPHKLRLPRKDYQTGVYLTVIFHLCLLIAFFGLKMQAEKHARMLEIAMLDFTQEQEREDEEQDVPDMLERGLQSLEQEVYQMLSQVRAGQRSELRNAAVNEERAARQGEGQSQLLREGAALQGRLAATRRMMQEPPPDADGEDGNTPAADPVGESDTYTGPSVMSYRLDGRSAYRLPVPVYKCEGGGVVVVSIVVAPRGNVVGARVDEAASSKDPCLHEMAVRAAEISRFSASTSSKNQQGAITYRFVEQ